MIRLCASTALNKLAARLLSKRLHIPSGAPVEMHVAIRSRSLPREASHVHAQVGVAKTAFKWPQSIHHINEITGLLGGGKALSKESSCVSCKKPPPEPPENNWVAKESPDFPLRHEP